jgi:UDP-glucose 4-epimerase
LDTILVTGATGFIGQKLINILKGDIKILSRNKNQCFDTIVCDFEKNSIPSNSLDNIDTVFHLAGFSHDIRDANEIEYLYHRVNVDATLRLAELSIKSGVKKFVFVSSVKAGGSSFCKTCSNESSQYDPEGVYGKTKREAELKLLKIGSESGMHVSIIRPSLVYGPNVKGNLQTMLAGVERGWFPPLPETGNRRSMIHVDDLVRAILLVSEDKRANGEIFIATDGTPYSSREVYDAMCKVLGKLPSKWSVPKALFDIASLASPRIKYKINKLLGDECYSSAKLEGLGFKAKKSLKDMNETDF